MPPAVRLATYLNSLVNNRVSTDVAAQAILGPDVAHHVVDPEGLLGLDPLAANELDAALAALVALERSGWILSLPMPGQLASLRGPAEFNQAAVDAGQAVIAQEADLGLIPYQVGQAVQWRVHRANRPLPPPTPYEAERLLAETVIGTGEVLAALDVASGTRPRLSIDTALAPGYPARQRATADRAMRLLFACDAADAEPGGAITSFEAEARQRELKRVRDAAVQALCAACSWWEQPD